MLNKIHFYALKVWKQNIFFRKYSFIVNPEKPIYRRW